MSTHDTRIARSVALAIVPAALSACAALTPDRSLQSTMTLAPGQSVSGRFEVPDGNDGYVVLARRRPVIAGPETPFPGSTHWQGDDVIRVAFLDDPPGTQGESKLGYASYFLADGRACRVVVRNTSAEPATFIWFVASPSDAVADWDVSTPTASSQ